MKLCLVVWLLILRSDDGLIKRTRLVTSKLVVQHSGVQLYIYICIYIYVYAYSTASSAVSPVQIRFFSSEAYNAASKNWL